MKNRFLIMTGMFLVLGTNLTKAGIRKDLEAANQIPDEQWVEKAKAFVTAFENLKVKLQKQWRIQLGDGECGIPINGVYPHNYNSEFVDKRGAVKEDSPVWLGCWLSGHLLTNENYSWVLGCKSASNTSFISPNKRSEIGQCCGSYWWEAGCCESCSRKIILAGVFCGPCTCFGVTMVAPFIFCSEANDEDEQATAFMRHVKHAIRPFTCNEFNVSTLQQAGQHLQDNFCTPVANLILKVSQKEELWQKEDLLQLLKLYCAYISCDVGFAAQDNFSQHKYNEVRHEIHQLLAKIICKSNENSGKLNEWLSKQLANWKNNPYSETLAGIGQYQIEIEFLLECSAKLKARDGANIAQNIQNTLNIIIDEVIENKNKRSKYREHQEEINNAYLMGLAMRNGAGVY